MTREIKLFKVWGTLAHEKQPVFYGGEVKPDNSLPWEEIKVTLPHGWHIEKNYLGDELIFRDGEEIGSYPEELIKANKSGNPILYDPDAKAWFTLDYSEPV